MVCCWAGEAGTSGNTAHRLIPDGCVGRPGVEDGRLFQAGGGRTLKGPRPYPAHELTGQPAVVSRTLAEDGLITEAGAVARVSAFLSVPWAPLSQGSERSVR